MHSFLGEILLPTISKIGIGTLGDFDIVKMITHFKAVFLREKGLQMACKNWIATKTSLHLGIFSLDYHRF